MIDIAQLNTFSCAKMKLYILHMSTTDADLHNPHLSLFKESMKRKGNFLKHIQFFPNSDLHLTDTIYESRCHINTHCIAMVSSH